MKKMIDFDKIEECIDNIDALYWWAKDFCMQNKCTVKKFIKDNYDEILEQIAQKKAQKSLFLEGQAVQKTSSMLAEKCKSFEKKTILSPKDIGFTLMAAGKPVKELHGLGKDQEIESIPLEKDAHGDLLVPKKLFDSRCNYVIDLIGSSFLLKKMARCAHKQQIELDADEDVCNVKIPLGSKEKSRIFTARRFKNGAILIS